MEKMMYLLTDEKNPEIIRNAVLKNFGVSTDDNSFSLGYKNYDIDMIIAAKDMGEKEASKAKEQINGMAGHFYQTETDYTDIRTNLVTYILWMQSVVMIRCSSEQDSDEVTKEIMETILGSSEEIDVLLLVSGDDEPDSIYCLDDGELCCIFSDDGESDMDSYLPPRKPCPFTDALAEQREKRENHEGTR